MMALADAAALIHGRASGGDAFFTGVSTDTRTIAPGDLFVALRGERFDGHAFLEAAARAGAVAALVDGAYAGAHPLPVVVVDDTKRALGELARGWRARLSPKLVGVAGSNGKTTVKEMLAAILVAHAGEDSVLYTRGNLNNDIGVPLTLLRLRAAHRFCAIELGTNHPGEIGYLASLARPSAALVNNAQREHLEFMKSVDDVAEENAAVYDSLPADGVAVVNADDARAAVFRRHAGTRRIVDFALEGTAAVTGGYALKPLTSEITIRTPAGAARATLAIPGVHNVRNALAAAACGFSLDISPEKIAQGLTAFRPYTGRLQVKQGKGGTTVIDDTYNANPDSVRAAIDVLAGCQGPTALVLGDMGEVGAQGEQFHREVGSYASSKKIDSLYALGEATRHAVEAFGEGARHFASVDDLARSVAAKTVLVKGSRFMKMERVVAALTGARAQGGH
ncbi:MAG: UDP-N-acetylmuramoyl-tripeptide--D-alanyl-D-alanine ligase [Betaproteobacteria bacterium]|nr:UDP-N-acetylmuramoyl-tripeptide--D-alanyl-D-alanine ligase [Betaproteobacteria bacterium]